MDRTRAKAADHVSKAELAEQEMKDSKPLAVKNYGVCDSGRNYQSHRRVHWKVALEWNKEVVLFPL